MSIFPKSTEPPVCSGSAVIKAVTIHGVAIIFCIFPKSTVPPIWSGGTVVVAVHGTAGREALDCDCASIVSVICLRQTLYSEVAPTMEYLYA